MLSWDDELNNWCLTIGYRRVYIVSERSVLGFTTFLAGLAADPVFPKFFHMHRTAIAISLFSVTHSWSRQRPLIHQISLSSSPTFCTYHCSIRKKERKQKTSRRVALALFSYDHYFTRHNFRNCGLANDPIKATNTNWLWLKTNISGFISGFIFNQAK